MDTVLNTMPKGVGDYLMENITVLEIVSMFSIGAYNAVEVGLSTFNCFTQYRGMYFWSMQVASWGILLHGLPAQVRYVSQAPNLPMCIPFIIGWYAMVTGQTVVLYSRLHLVAEDRSSLCWIPRMIATNSIILHIPMTVLFFGVNLGDPRFIRPAQIYDRIQLTGFCVQDFIICGIYIREATRALQPVLEARGREGRKVIYHLILVNIVVVLMNAALLFTEYKAHYIQISFKTVVYSIKLKMEFSVLRRLRSLTRTYPFVCQHESDHPRRSSDINIFDMVLARSRRPPDVEAPADVVRATPLSSPNSTFEFHQALRETASNENMLSRATSLALPPESSPSAELQDRPRNGSSATSSTVETALFESPNSTA